MNIERIKCIGYTSCTFTIVCLGITLFAGSPPVLIGLTVGFAICVISSTIALIIARRNQNSGGEYAQV